MENNLNQNDTYGVMNGINVEEKTPKNKQYVRMVFITLLIITMFVGGYFALNNESVKNQFQQAIGSLTPIAEEISTVQEPLSPPEGIQNRSLPWIEMKSDKDSYNINDTVIITLMGYLGDKNIVGYDLLMNIDPASWEVVSINSAIPDFSIKEFDRGNFFSVTGFKDLQSDAPFLFNSTDILIVTLKPKITGDLLVSVLKNEGAEVTRFVDENVESIEPQIGSLRINVTQ